MREKQEQTLLQKIQRLAYVALRTIRLERDCNQEPWGGPKFQIPPELRRLVTDHMTLRFDFDKQLEMVTPMGSK